jgi:transposase
VIGPILILGIPVDFILFGLTLLGVALFHHHTLPIALAGRRAESKDRPELKRSRYLWLKNERHLSAEQSASLDLLSRMHLKTARAYRLRLAFQEIYDQPSPGWGELVLDRWYSWAIRSRLEPMKEAARSIMRHRDGILRWFTSKIANGLIEGINSLVQAAKA